jgi:hypothetical protein
MLESRHFERKHIEAGHKLNAACPDMEFGLIMRGTYNEFTVWPYASP